VIIGKIEAMNGNVDDNLHLNSGDGTLLSRDHTDLMLLASKGQPTDGGGQSFGGRGYSSPSMVSTGGGGRS
jgi:hypothetical protein